MLFKAPSVSRSCSVNARNLVAGACLGKHQAPSHFAMMSTHLGSLLSCTRACKILSASAASLLWCQVGKLHKHRLHRGSAVLTQNSYSTLNYLGPVQQGLDSNSHTSDHNYGGKLNICSAIAHRLAYHTSSRVICVCLGV